MTEINDLAKKATWKELSKEEIAYVEKKFKEAIPGEDLDLSSYIYILGRIGATAHRPAIEKYLECPLDSYAAGQALKILCIYWRYTEDYLEKVMAFIKGVEWDVNDDVRLMAFSVAGEHLRRTDHKKPLDQELLKLLSCFFFDPRSIPGYQGDECYHDLLRSCAYTALARAVGKNHYEILDGDSIEDLITQNRLDELDPTVLEKIRFFSKL